MSVETTGLPVLAQTRQHEGVTASGVEQQDLTTRHADRPALHP
jgi:hypothetical protein